MANKTELIRADMARTRAALTMKLDALEGRTLGAVKETAEAVAGVAETVEDTVEAASKAVKKTVKKTARFFDIGRQAEKHPWAVMGGAVAAGFCASWLASRLSSRSAAEGGGYRDLQRVPERSVGTMEARAPRQKGPGLLSSLGKLLGPGLEEVKQMAIGAALGVARDVALKAVPNEWTQEVSNVFTNLTEQLGGTMPPVAEASTQLADESAPALEQRSRWEKEPPGEGRPQPGKKKPHGNGRHSQSAAR